MKIGLIYKSKLIQKKKNESYETLEHQLIFKIRFDIRFMSVLKGLGIIYEDDCVERLTDQK